ncbi:USP6 N-terminal-like protein [Geodia barretti]|uniref:USP6 N-terminal-like protein n=2 Tax=Geodia barretti TaxID=519541 RepID=A0AA35XHX4_GEOBA|nr:USP6 N-terminal-like protein [Geodia barretti]
MAATRTHAQLFNSHGFAVMSAAEEYNMSYEDSGIPSVCETFKEVLAECESCGMRKPPILLKKCRQLIKVGGHNSMRGDIWRVFLGISETKTRTNFDYKGNVAELGERLNKCGLTESTCDANIRRISALLDGQYLPLSEEDIKWLRNARQIMLDIGRTFPTHRLYIGETKEKISLLRVLMMYAKFNTSVGYCQGMAYIAALLLMHMTNEEDVFWSILTIFDSEKYLARFYDRKLSRMQTCGGIFSLLLKDRQTKLAQHLVAYTHCMYILSILQKRAGVRYL